MTDVIHWLIHTDAGLLARVLAGAVIFAALAIIDVIQHGAAANRWREYSVLLVCVTAALLYGAINDSITSRISWEYFYYGKGLEAVLGPMTPPDMAALHRQAVKVGLKATWSAGLIFGVVLLLANNPRQGLVRLRNRELLRLVPVIFLSAGTFALIGAGLGYAGFLTHLSGDLEKITQANLFRPQRFLCTFGIHLGGYVGGVVGTIISVVLIRRYRNKMRFTSTQR